MGLNFQRIRRRGRQTAIIVMAAACGAAILVDYVHVSGARLMQTSPHRIVVLDPASLQTADVPLIPENVKTADDLAIRHDWRHVYLAYDDGTVSLMDLKQGDIYTIRSPSGLKYTHFSGDYAACLSSDPPGTVVLQNLKTSTIDSFSIPSVSPVTPQDFLLFPDGRIGLLRGAMLNVYGVRCGEYTLLDEVVFFRNPHINPRHRGHVLGESFFFSHPLVVGVSLSAPFSAVVYNCETGTRLLYDLYNPDSLRAVQWWFIFTAFDDQFFIIKVPTSPRKDFPVIVYGTKVTGPSNVWRFDDSDFVRQHTIYLADDDFYKSTLPLPVALYIDVFRTSLSVPTTEIGTVYRFGKFTYTISCLTRWFSALNFFGVGETGFGPDVNRPRAIPLVLSPYRLVILHDWASSGI